jgi:hypothetical protein
LNHQDTKFTKRAQRFSLVFDCFKRKRPSVFDIPAGSMKFHNVKTGDFLGVLGVLVVKSAGRIAE